MMGFLRRQRRSEFVERRLYEQEPSTYSVPRFEEWKEAGCPIPAGHPDSARLADIASAASTTRDWESARLMRSADVWARFALATNPFVSTFALWGDARTGFGLAGDPNRWVQLAVLYRRQQPPDAVMDVLNAGADNAEQVA